MRFFMNHAKSGTAENATRFADSGRPVTRQKTPWSVSPSSGNPSKRAWFIGSYANWSAGTMPAMRAAKGRW